ncbi:RAQPRD family integrative conjugative element protein [Pseudomonas sp. MPFS]|uniref:integrative conjugative element protein, RAQPRD family n=1 Tax=Pseudomonas sp. MPFS TaxID=2795724 RepID=UPI001F139934|nr:RAQPRD family integrative conjugative element protein [Pseudomonas sp. MPFS]UMZ10677.1 RAQPRD family integrative conjugative element protein [Pseudomonas sp. MPFS]
MTALAMIVAGGIAVSPVVKAATASEQTNIEVMVRQLNALEDSARRSSTIAGEPGQRYYFDYDRLAADIQRIRQGLQAYLTPSRAQPRDAADLSGQYTTGGKRQ